MKKIRLAATLLLFIAVLFQAAQAQQNRVGIGAMTGTPNGLSIKSWIGDDIAIDGALSFTLGNNSSSLYLHSDVLIHNDLSDDGFDVEEGTLSFYYGAGLRLQWLDVVDDVYTGLRGPAGISYMFERAPGELFFELVPTLDLSPSFRFSFGGAIGARYYLKN